jgi:hypothetical protein
MYKVTDNMSGHYGMRGHLFNLFFEQNLVSLVKDNKRARLELLLVLLNNLEGPF